mgnify:CR=1 FL=1
MNLVKQLRTWDEMPEYDSDAFHWLDVKTAEAADLIERQAAQIEMMREALSKIEYLESANGCIMSAGDCSSVATEALSTTPDQALEQFAAKVREQCAQMLLNGSFLHDQAPDKLLAAEAAKAIRAIKELP